MITRTYKTEGIVLARINYSEADKIITIFSKHYGKIKCLAKGIRKLTSRKGGNLELFNLVSLFLVKGKNLDIVTEVILINPFSNFKNNSRKVATAFHLSQLIDQMTREEQANWQIFELLKKTFRKLELPDVNLEKLRIEYKTKLLKFTGFGWPEKIDELSLNSHIEKIIEKKVQLPYD